MAGSLKDDEFFGFGHLCHEGLDAIQGAEGIEAALKEELGFGDGEKEGEVRAIDGNAEANQFSDAVILGADAQADPGSEAETGEEDGNGGELRGEIIQRGANVVSFAAAEVVRSRTAAGAAEIEAQDGKARAMEGLGSAEDDLIVESAAVERMRVADQRDTLRRRIGDRPEHGFQASRGPFEKQAVMKRSGHEREKQV